MLARLFVVIGFTSLLCVACGGALPLFESTARATAKESAQPAAKLSSAVRFTHRGRVEALLRQDGRLDQGARLFGSLRPDWTFVSPRGVLFATLHPDGRLELAHGERSAAVIDDSGRATLSARTTVAIAEDGRLTGMPEGEAPLRFVGLAPTDRRAAMFVFFAWSMTAARIEATWDDVRTLRRTIDVARIQNGGRCPRSTADLVSQGLLDRDSLATDSWGSEFRIECSAGAAPLVLSSGPDRRPGTDDDIRSDR